MNLQFTLAARYLAGRKLRTTLTTLAVVFGVLVLFGMNTMLPTLTQAFQANAFASASQVDAVITHRIQEPFPVETMDAVWDVDGVRAVSGSLYRLVNLPEDYFDNDASEPDRVTALALTGIDPAQARSVRAYLVVDGRFLEADDGDVAVITQSLSDMLTLKVGDVLTIPTPKGTIDLTIVGLLPERIHPGNEEVLVSLAEAQAILSLPGAINQIEVNFDTLNESRRMEIEIYIRMALGTNYVVGVLDAGSEFLTTLKASQAVFILLGVLAVMMGGFIIFNTFRTIVIERRRDIGMLRAVGARRRTVVGAILAEGLIQGIVGTGFGLLLGYLLALGLMRFIEPIMGQFFNLQFDKPVVDSWLVAGSIIIGVGVTVLSGWFPALAASRVTPLEALRPSVGETQIKCSAGFWAWMGAGLIVIGLAALFTNRLAFLIPGCVSFILGLVLAAQALVRPLANFFSRALVLIFARNGTGELAEGNLTRQPTRAVVTASTTMIALAIVMLAASMVSSVTVGFERALKNSIGGEYVILPPAVTVWGGNVGAQPGLANDLRALGPVETVSTMRYAETQISEVSTSLLAFDEVYPQIADLSWVKGDPETAYAALFSERAIIINAPLQTATRLQVGDEIPLLTPSGEIIYRVVGVAGDYLNAKTTTAYISQANLLTDFKRSEDVLFLINMVEGTSRDEAVATLDPLLKPYPQFKLVAAQEFYEQNLSLFEAATSGILALLVFLAVPSLIAMVNTLAIGVIERTREIGMLRAVGATRRQVRTIILAEAVLLAAIGTLFGLSTGLYLGYMLVETFKEIGFPMVYVFPLEYALYVGVAGIVFGGIAALLPARQAARMNVVAALRYE